MNKISAELITHSKNPQGDELLTYVLTFPRFILAEAKTHRILSNLDEGIEVYNTECSINSSTEVSKNSASSRAIPFNKMVKAVMEDPFVPIAWQKSHSGMQGTEYITDKNTLELVIDEWLYSRIEAVNKASKLAKLGVTKQLCNRLLEPFAWHTVLLTGSEFKNFFNLRCPLFVNEHENGEDISYSRKDFITKLKIRYPNNWETELKDFHGIVNGTDEEWFSLSKSQAEIHIQALAESMWDEFNSSEPKLLQPGEFHIPFGDNIDMKRLSEVYDGFSSVSEPFETRFLNLDTLKLKVAVSRCARISYGNFHGKDSYEADIKLYDRLLESMHLSPFEHIAQTMPDEEYYSWVRGKLDVETCDNPNCDDSLTMPEERYDKDKAGWVDNFKGFKSLRKTLNV